MTIVLFRLRVGKNNTYINALKQQMKEQQLTKLSEFEMSDREKKMNKLNLQQVAKNDPDRYKIMAGK